MQYENLLRELRLYLEEKQGDKEKLQQLQQLALQFIRSEQRMVEKMNVSILLGQIGDPRIVDPSDESYWIKVEVSFLDLLVGKFLVTIQEWCQFYESDNYKNDKYWTPDGIVWREADRPSWGELAKGEEVKDFISPNQPVVGVCFHEAQAFAAFHNSRLMYFDERLDVIRGQERRVYPWGNDFGRGNANTKEEVLQRPSPVGIFMRDQTPNGIFDLAGNVAEWTSDQDEEGCRIHPGSWRSDMLSAWPKASMLVSPSTRLDCLGFRLVRDLPEDI